MKFKKIVSLMLACALTFNSSVISFASAENDADLAGKVNDLEKQLIISEVEKRVLESKAKDLMEKNSELKEKVENLEKKIKELPDNSSAKEYANAAIEIVGKVIIALFLFYYGIPLLISVFTIVAGGFFALIPRFFR